MDTKNLKIFNPIISLEFIYTKKCNIKCDHCINNCGPFETSKVDLNTCLSVLPLLKEEGIKEIGFTGGEPLLYFDEMIALFSAAKKNKVNPKLISNGFWGSSPEKTEKMLSKLVSAGLMCLNISTDNFHVKFIPEKNIINIFDAARKYKKLQIILRVAVSKDYSFLDFLVNNKEYFTKIHADKKPFHVLSQILVPAGRAAKNVSNKTYFISNKKLLKQKCPFLGKPTINHDGKMFVCCNGFEGSNTAFKFADFNTDSHKKSIEAYRKNIFVFYLRHKGPAFIFDLAKKNKLKKVNKVKKVLQGYASLCDFCVFSLSPYEKKSINKMLLNELNKDIELQKIAKTELKNKKKIAKESVNK